MMPELDGPEVCRRVRRELPLANMYLILRHRPRDPRRHRRRARRRRRRLRDQAVRPRRAARARRRRRARAVAAGAARPSASTELQAALSNVKQLHGLLPICSYCKRIRGDDQYWQQVEAYIAEHSDAQFSHGICPTCYVAVSAELDGRRREAHR